MIIVFWIAGMFIACNAVFSLCELATHLALHRRLREIVGDKIEVIGPVDPVPLKFPVGTAHVTAEVSKASIESLERASVEVGHTLKIAGVVAGPVAVAVVYGVLLLMSPSSSIPFWSLLLLPLSGVASAGKRGLRADRRKLGEIRAFLNQLFVAGFTVASLISVTVILILRWLRVLL